MNMNQNTSYPVVMPPIPQQEFNALFQGQVQNCMLYDTQEVKNHLALQRVKERDAHKSTLRIQERLISDKRKMKRQEFMEQQGTIYLEEVNGVGEQLRKIKVWSCNAISVERYTREEINEELFQIIALTENGEIRSELYPADWLTSSNKLQKTALIKYDCTSNQADKTAAWRWIWKKLITMYDETTPQYIPAFPGWHKTEKEYHLWAGNKSDTLLLSREIKDYLLRYQPEQSLEEVNELFNYDNAADVGVVGSLLIIRLVALVSALCTQEPLSGSVVLYGDSALTVAKRLLSVSDTDNNVLNLEADRLNVIRSKVGKLRANVAIFVLTSSESKSTRNRINDVLSWVNSGYVEGKKVAVPYVFCMEELSTDIPLENSILIDVDSIQCDDWEIPFTALQSWWIDTVEKSGILLVENLQAGMQRKSTKRSETIKNIGETIVEETDKFMQSDCCERLQLILQAGSEMIDRQLSVQFSHVLNVFHDKVFEYADAGQIRFCDNDNRDSCYVGKCIYYDETFYYFSKDVLAWICNMAKLDSKSLLAIKRQLVELGYVKLYRNNGNHNQELQVDIAVNNEMGKKEYISVFAVKRCFWEDSYSICLYERGQ